ncbi:MAG: DUF448 domain-containing protein [Polyangiaceae bacterium]
MSENEKHEGEPNARTCVGCGSKDDPRALVRLVFEPVSGMIMVDAKGKAVGRGAHVHPTPKCVHDACKSGLSKSFRANVKASSGDLARDIVLALDRRVEGLVVAARGASALAVGSEKAFAALQRGAPLALVANDAASIAQKLEVTLAAGEGRALVWRDKAGLGAAADKGEVAIVAIENAGIARAIADAVRAMASLKNSGAVEANAADGSEVVR